MTAPSPDWRYLSESINRCNAAYLMDEDAVKAHYDSISATIIARISTPSQQAVLSIAHDGVYDLDISGSRVTEGGLSDHIHDLLTDINCDPLDVGNGKLVATDPYNNARWLFRTWLPGVLPTGKLRIRGHSLGGWKATYSVDFIDPSRIISIESWDSPKQANTTWWEAFPQTVKYAQMYHEKDPWGQWPWEDETLTHGPDDIIWIKNGEYVLSHNSDLPDPTMFNLYDITHSSDHGPESIILAVNKLAMPVSS